MRYMGIISRANSAVRAAAKRIMSHAMVLLAATACVHEFPDLSTPAEMTLNLKFNIGMNVHVNMDIEADGTLEGIVTDSDRNVPEILPEEYDLRVITRFYRQRRDGDYDLSNADYEFIFTEDDTYATNIKGKISIAEGKYRIYAWADYVPQGQTEDHHYNTDDFSYVSCSKQYTGATDSKCAYSGTQDIEIIRRGGIEGEFHIHLDFHTPLAKIVLIANDLEEFITKTYTMLMAKEHGSNKAKSTPSKAIDLNEFDVHFTYESDGLSDKYGESKPAMYNLPTAFNIFRDEETASTKSVTFKTKMERLSSGEARLGFDYVFPHDGHTYLSMAVYLQDGTQVARTPAIAIPVKRNQVTVMRGRFLMQNVEGGAEIKPEYNGDHNHEIHE